ncbi:MAG: putative phosphoesterase [halophilic archaeon J07HX5]|nr:MAG: putative phosphoesterase [halophilic archaeon J07HX5]
MTATGSASAVRASVSWAIGNHCLRCSCSGPYCVVGDESLIEIRRNGRVMTERRHATDLIAERRLNLRRGGESSCVHAVRAACDNDDQLVGSKRERTRNLCPVTANSAGGVSGGLSAGRELLDVNLDVMIALGATAERRGLLVHIHRYLGHQLVVCRRRRLCHNPGKRGHPRVSDPLAARPQASADPVSASKAAVR